MLNASSVVEKQRSDNSAGHSHKHCGRDCLDERVHSRQGRGTAKSQSQQLKQTRRSRKVRIVSQAPFYELRGVHVELVGVYVAGLVRARGQENVCTQAS